MTSAATPTAPAAIAITHPTYQYTARGQPGLMVFHRRSPRDGVWKREELHPTQDVVAAFAPAAIKALAAEYPELAGYWSCDELDACALDYMAAQFPGAAVVFVDPTPAQPEEAVRALRVPAAPSSASSKD